MLSNFRNCLKNQACLMQIFSWFYNIVMCNNFWRYALSSKVNCSGAFLNHTTLKIIGADSRVILMPGTRLSHCKLFLYGNKCTFVIGGA